MDLSVHVDLSHSILDEQFQHPSAGDEAFLEGLLFAVESHVVHPSVCWAGGGNAK